MYCNEINTRGASAQARNSNPTQTTMGGGCTDEYTVGENSGHGLIDLRGAGAAQYGFGYVSTLYGSVSLRLKCPRLFVAV